MALCGHNRNVIHHNDGKSHLSFSSRISHPIGPEPKLGYPTRLLVQLGPLLTIVGSIGRCKVDCFGCQDGQRK